ncbi:4-hydroxy-3-methylbut-2-enyl diphosphate reductase [Arenicella chitinivorans]|uniref:4-hydroxy-3-methylbut-2-enyl diphosphate reductase n=1 Tax=Arenicella chitinivorans TaxID=1329800 RepID=A0A918RRC5_9GAMM|nr:4-hydroxy-3-methylbut-2-enyl diphosphate reductase [Arenicella chitinivorans]GHA07232.1 4-hydroxy-3-methylbut-2-enyl diphosphate reductase [Arenicella chitinivorans]
MKILLANPRGFCAGVDRAIEIVERALALFEAPIYVRHEVVHNRFVVDDLKRKGAVFVEELDEVPDGATVIFSAHGVSQQVQNDAASRDLKVFDATCPLVTKVHMEVKRYRDRGTEIILIGHAGHPEVEGTMGQADSGMHLIEEPSDVPSLQVQDPDNLAYVTQTTLSVDDTRKVIDALKARFPNIQGPRKDDICYATQNRQDAVRALSRDADVVIVVGSPNSSNSNRLAELSQNIGVPSYLVDNPAQIDRAWFDGVDVVGVTAGASAPEILVKQVIDQIKHWGGTVVNEANGPIENVSFSLPIELRVGKSV